MKKHKSCLLLNARVIHKFRGQVGQSVVSHGLTLMHFIWCALILSQEPVVSLTDPVEKSAVVVIGGVADGGDRRMTSSERVVHDCIGVCSVKVGLLVGFRDHTLWNGRELALLLTDAIYS